jgi:hypothetical protein
MIEPGRNDIYTWRDCPEFNLEKRQEDGRFFKKTNWINVRKINVETGEEVEVKRWCRIGKVSILRPCEFNRETGNCPFNYPQ